MAGADIDYRIALISMLSLLTGIRAFFRVRTRTLRERIFSDRAERGLNALWVALGTPLLASVFAFIFEPGMVTWSSFPLAPPLRWAGAALGLTAVFLILEVHLELGANFSPTLRLLPDHSLVTTGLYRWVRHPMYSSYFLLFAGAGLLTANWLIGGTGLGIIISQMTIRVPREERILQERFGGAHGVYAAATGKFFPRIRPW